MNSIADIVAGRLPRSWHEAVAVVQEVARLTPGLPVPEPQDVLLDADGNLSVGFGSESDDDPVVQLAKLLEMMLDGTECPLPLQQLAAENSRVPPAHSSVASFTRALAFFERPNRAGDLAALAGRLGGRGRAPRPQPEPADIREASPEAVEQNLEMLREKVAQSPAAAVVDDERRAGTSSQMWIRPAIAAVLLLVVALVAGAWLGSRGMSPTHGFSVAVETAESKLADTLSKSLDRLGGVEAASPATEAVAKAPVEKAPAANVPTGTARRPARSRPAPARTALGDRGSKPEKPRGAPPVLAGLDLEANPSVAVASPLLIPSVLDFSRVYSSADAGVEPARLRRPQLPSQPEPSDTTGYFDIIVDEQGRVEEVRLISPTRRYYDRMMVAAAKAWMFHPARVNGYAVKYRTRIPIIGPPPM